jgi:hypothetical protein
VAWHLHIEWKKHCFKYAGVNLFKEDQISMPHPLISFSFSGGIADESELNFYEAGTS